VDIFVRTSLLEVVNELGPPLARCLVWYRTNGNRRCGDRREAFETGGEIVEVWNLHLAISNEQLGSLFFVDNEKLPQKTCKRARTRQLSKPAQVTASEE
jgi:hypothetical protein